MERLLATLGALIHIFGTNCKIHGLLPNHTLICPVRNTLIVYLLGLIVLNSVLESSIFALLVRHQFLVTTLNNSSCYIGDCNTQVIQHRWFMEPL